MSTDEAIPTRRSTQGWIDEVSELRHRTRVARQGFWLPVLLLGLLTLGAIPLYFGQSQAAQMGLPPGGTIKQASLAQLGPPKANLGDEGVNGKWYAVPNCRIVHKVVYEPCDGTFSTYKTVDYFPTGEVTSQQAVALYWLIGLTLCYLAIGLWYRARARRKGVATRYLPFVTSGIALLALLVITTPHVKKLLGISFLPGAAVGDFNIRGLTPLITIGIGLIVLAWCERSRWLLAFSLAFLALAVAADLYDFQNLAFRVGIDPSEIYAPATGIFLAGLVLTVGGAIFGLIQRFAK